MPLEMIYMYIAPRIAFHEEQKFGTLLGKKCQNTINELSIDYSFANLTEEESIQ